LIHALIDSLRGLPAFLNPGLMAGDSRVCRSLGVGHDGEGEGGKDGWIGRGVFRRGDRVRRRAGESFAEMQFDMRIARAREQGVGEALLRAAVISASPIASNVVVSRDGGPAGSGEAMRVSRAMRKSGNVTLTAIRNAKTI
jgi:hypothetical protein